jgi:hypothetical protein
MQFLLEVAKAVAKDASIGGLKVVAAAGLDQLIGRLRRRKALRRFGMELGAWQEYLRDAPACARAGRALPPPPPRILFADAQNLLDLSRDLDHDGRAALTVIQFCLADIESLAGGAPDVTRVERLCRYFDRSLATLGAGRHLAG